MFAEVIFFKENKLVDLSMDFSVKVIKLCEGLAFYEKPCYNK